MRIVLVPVLLGLVLRLVVLGPVERLLPALPLVSVVGITAVVAAVFSVWHNVSGSLLASWWTRKDPVGRLARVS